MHDPRDPIDLMRDFDPGAPMSPLPPAEVRRRGERRRRRTTSLVAVGAAVAVAAVAIPLAVLSGGDERALEPAVPREQTTISADADLLDASEVPTRRGLDPWTTDTDDRADRTPVITCAPGSIADLEPVASLERTFVTEFTLPAGTTADPSAPDVPGGQAKEAVLEFADADAASAAYDEATGWLDDCSGDDQARSLDVGDSSGGGQRTQFSSWSLGAADACADSCDLARFVDMAVTQVDDRLVLTSTQVITGPQPPEDFRAVDDYRYAAAAKARPDVDAPRTDETEPDQSATSEPVEPTQSSQPSQPGQVGDIALDPDGELGGADLTVRGPSSSAQGVELPDSFCGRDLWPADGVEGRLALTVVGPEFGLERELAVFTSADEAVAVVDALRAAVEECPRVALADGAGEVLVDAVDVDSGYDDASFARSFSPDAQSIGGDGYQFVRVGRAVLATHTSGELGDADGAARAVEGLNDDNRQITSQLCGFTEAGC